MEEGVFSAEFNSRAGICICRKEMKDFLPHMKVGTVVCIPGGVEVKVSEPAEAAQPSLPLSLRGWIKSHSAMRIPLLCTKRSPPPILEGNLCISGFFQNI